MTAPGTFVTIGIKEGTDDTLRERFPKTFRVVAPHQLIRLPHPQPLHVGGTTSESVLYSLGHPGETLSPVTTLSPAILRHFRHIAHGLRKQPQPLHIFCLVDDWSPYGSTRILEEAVRFFLPLSVSLVLHLIVWHPTPSEFRRVLSEARNFPFPVEIGSIVPVTTLQEENSLAAYLDLLQTDQEHLFEMHLPLSGASKLTRRRLAPTHQILFLNHNLHGLSLFGQQLEQYAQEGLTYCPSAVASPPAILSALDRSNHIIAYTATPTYLQAYMGNEVTHPYYESLVFRSSTELIGALLSPHLQYHHLPYRSLVFLEEETHADFDTLLASLLKQRKESLYYCHFLIPNDVTGSHIVTNMAIDPLYPYESLHAYA